MCPDAELLSAFADGEVREPWKARLLGHLAECPACADRVASYRRLGERLAAPDPGLDEAAAAERILARLDGRLDGRLGATGGHRVLSPRGPASPWRRTVALPLPLAYAAAAALVFFAGIATSSFFRPRAELPASIAAADISSPAGGASSIEELLRFLEGQDAQVSLTIRLPGDATYAASGEPLIMKAPSIQEVANPAAGGAPDGEAP